MINTDKKINEKKIGLFDSGIGGYSVLAELFKTLPSAHYFYVSDDAFAPYGPKSDDFITERSFIIAQALKEQNVELIVVACNTATAASIDRLRVKFPDMTFVGVEPYLNAYYKIPVGLTPAQKKMMVLTTESTGKSERFKRLKERLDPDSQIDHYGLVNLAKLIEDFYYSPNDREQFYKSLEEELAFLKPHRYSFAILGCTHYPLIRKKIEKILNLKTISPDAHIAQRVLALSGGDEAINQNLIPDFYNFFSTKNNIWIKKYRASLLGPFKEIKL